jgi:hypothetical protein
MIWRGAYIRKLVPFQAPSRKFRVSRPDKASEASDLGNPLIGYGLASPALDLVCTRYKTMLTRAVREDKVISKVLMSSAPCSFIRLIISEVKYNYPFVNKLKWSRVMANMYLLLGGIITVLRYLKVRLKPWSLLKQEIVAKGT